MAYNFKVKETTEACIAWIREFFDKNGPNCKAVIGISGGKDSTIVAKLCVEALGKDRVYGVSMPEGYTDENTYGINMARKVIDYLGIDSVEIDISAAVNSIKSGIGSGLYNNSIQGDPDTSIKLTSQSIINLPPRIRMATLYAVSQSVNGRVANTCNLSEDWVGYSTRYGDSVGDFSPLSRLTVDEIKKMGRFLGIPDEFVDQVPSDGLCGQTDEDRFGFTYAVLDHYIRTGEIDDAEVKTKIDNMHEKNLFKLQLMPCFETPAVINFGEAYEE